MQRPTVVPSDEERALITRILERTNSLQAGFLTTDIAIDVFNRSGLSRLELRDIWRLADADSNGRITQDELAVAVRLMGWIQSGRAFSEALLEEPGPLPIIEGIAPPTPPQKEPGLSPGPVFPPVVPSDIQAFYDIFQAAGPTSGYLEGDKVRDIYLKSNLAFRDLSSIWVLLDTTQRGRLDFQEFATGMYLIQGIRSCHFGGVPSSVPFEVRNEIENISNELQSPFLAPGETPPMPVPTVSPPPPSRPIPPTPPAPPTKTPRVPPKPPPVKPKPDSKPWPVTPQERTEYEAEFAQLGSGYITKDIAWGGLRRYNVSEEDISQILHLSSIRNDGHLNSDEFAVAMHLLKNKLNGKAIPAELPPSLIPPSLRQSSSRSSTIYKPSSPTKDAPYPTPLQSPLHKRSASHQVSRSPSAFYLVSPSAEVLGPANPGLRGSPTSYSPTFEGTIYPQNGRIGTQPELISRRSTLSFASPLPEGDPLEELKSETKTLRRQIDNLLDQVSTQNELRKENAALRSENGELKTKISELEANVASVITQMHSNDNALVEELAKEIDRLTRRIGELEETETRMQQTVGILEVSKRDNANLKTQIRDLQNAEASHKVEMEDAKHAMQDLEAENKDLKTRLEDITKAISAPDTKDSKLATKQLRVLLQETTRENNTLKDRVRQVERSMEALLTSQDASKSEELQRHNWELQMQVQELEQLTAQLQSSQDDHHLQQLLAVVSRENEGMKTAMRELQSTVTQQRTEHENRATDLQRRIEQLTQENERLKIDLRNSRRHSADDVPPPAYDDAYIPPDVS